MNYNDYYNKQSNNQVFEGYRFQRGYGLGGVFKKLYRWFMPILKHHAVPAVKTVGKELLKGATNLAKDAINGKNIKESANIRFNETLNQLSDHAGVKRKIDEINNIMEGDGMGSNINTPILKKKIKTKKKFKFLKTNFLKKQKDIFN